MAVVIRLRRIGKNPKKRPHFRITVMDKREGRDSRFLEEIGFYDPARNPAAIKIKKERFDFWIKRGAKPSDTVKSIINKTEDKHAESTNS